MTRSCPLRPVRRRFETTRRIMFLPQKQHHPCSSTEGLSSHAVLALPVGGSTAARSGCLRRCSLHALRRLGVAASSAVPLWPSKPASYRPISRALRPTPRLMRCIRSEKAQRENPQTAHHDDTSSGHPPIVGLKHKYVVGRPALASLWRPMCRDPLRDRAKLCL